ncbi:MAG: peroxiredoxin [Pyrinomonadaceae bacterium]|nr:peroxiredoxin [Pyrinomonadaceae bacterium]
MKFTKETIIACLLATIACACAITAQTISTTATDASANANARSADTPVSAAPKVGDAAPDFRLPYATQEKIYLKPEEQMALSALRGKTVVLAFYPADWSGGCTKEVCTLRDTFAELSKLNATVLGLSGDYVFSHHEWAKHHKLQFPLLSDHDHRVARMYGSFDEASGYNRRSIFVIDRNGMVRYSNLQFKAGDAGDYNRLRAELEKLK